MVQFPMDDPRSRILIQRNGEYFGLWDIDVRGWTTVDIPGWWDCVEQSEPFVGAFERGWDFRVASDWKQEGVGHVPVTRFFFPPTDRDNAMLFKLTFGGQV